MFTLNKNSFKNSFKNKLKQEYKCFDIFLCLIFFVLFFYARDARAAIFDKSSFIEGEPVMTATNGFATVIFNITPDAHLSYPILNVPSYPSNWILNFYDNNNPDAPYTSLPVGQYSFVTLSDVGTDCFLNYLTYQECKLAPEFVGEYVFSVVSPPSGGGGGGEDTPPVLDSELTPSGSYLNYIQNYPPVINIFSTLKDMLFSDNLTVDYKVTDQNDTDNSKSYNGLPDNPTSIFYSDKITNWYDNFSESTNKTVIAKEQPKEGKYKWSVKDLVPGVLYRIIVEATDKASLWSQSMTDYFGVDFTPPVFTVKTNPTAVRSGAVAISIDSSEDLSGAPEVSVVQNGGETKKVIMKGEKSHYEGSYTVVPLYDGTASIEVTGTDKAFNIGKVIIGGGTFSVGMDPPAKPIINKYQEKIVTDKESIDIAGTARTDTEVILKVNGVEISKVKPDTKGDFTFTKILLDKKKNKGINYISIYTRDPLLSISEGVPIEVKYNIAPTIKIIKPLDKDLLSNISPINVEGNDENGDTLFYTYQVLSQTDYNNKIFNWITLSDNDPSSTFSWNTTEVEDGNYVLQVIANDGNTETTSNTVQVSIKNVLPFFRFEDGRNTITNQSNISIRGKALTSVNISPRPDIMSVAYSLDQGNTWTPVKIYKEVGNYQKKFTAEFSGLEEGIHPILWRTKDSRGFIGKIVHSIIVDKTAPKMPIVTSPKIEKDIVINNENDENLNKSGVQISIKGNAEALSFVTLMYNDKMFTTKTLATGEYSFHDVTFDKMGKYELSLYAKDTAGNKSSTTNLSIIYNNLPIISFLNPKPFGGISGKTNLSWSIKDIDGDNISDVIVSYRNKDKDSQFKSLVTNADAIGTYEWDTDVLPESNNYELKIEAKDTYSSTSSTTSFSIDRTPPSITSLSFSKSEGSFLNKDLSFVALGSQMDSLSGVEYIEYSIEDSDGNVTPWYKGLITNGYLKNKGDFVIKHPLMKEDGVYKINVRAVDRASNLSPISSLSLAVDKSEPRVGSFFIEKDGVNLSPDDNGDIEIYKNSIFNFNVSLENDIESASIKIGEEIFALNKDMKTGLWNVPILLRDENPLKMYISARDISGNVIKDKELGNIKVFPLGNVSLVSNSGKVLVAGADIKVLKLNTTTEQYEDFGINKNGDTNISTNQNGEYDLMLPSGSYKFVITNPEINTLKYNFELNRPSIVHLDFEVKPVSDFMKFINNFLNIFK